MKGGMNTVGMNKRGMNKSWIKRMVLRSGALGAMSGLRGRGAAVLMYHSVMDDPAAARDTLGEIVHSTEEFRRQMEELAGRAHPVSLDEVRSYAQGEKPAPARAVAVTFDDGYADNLEVAAPILNRLGIPGAVYVTVECIEKKQLPWPARLRHAFRRTGKPYWEEMTGKRWALDGAEQRESAFWRASEECARLAGEAQDRFVAALEQDLDVEPSKTDLMMTGEQMREMIRQGHTIGSHTLTHPNMAYLDAASAERELGESRRRLEEATASRVVHFAYPGPALSPIWSVETLAASRRAGYETAVTTTSGLVRKGDDPLCLRRLGAAKNLEQWRWNLECTFAGRRM